MKRRKYLSSTLGIVSSGIISRSNIINGGVLAASFNISSNPIRASKVNSDNLIVTLERINLRFQNISDTSTPIKLRLYVIQNGSGIEYKVTDYNVQIPSSSGSIELDSISVNINNSQFSVSDSDRITLSLRATHPETNTDSDSTTLVKPANIPDNGVSKYKFENTNSSVSTAVDSWSENDMTIFGASYNTQSQFGTYSLYFDGYDDEATVPIGPELYDGSFSVSLWVNLNGTSNNKAILTYSRASRFWSLSSQNVDNSEDYELIINGSSVVSTNKYTTTSFVHIALTYDGSKSILYINGDEIGSHTEQIMTDQSEDKTKIGNFNSGNGGDFTEMYIDNLAFYDTNLKPSTIQEISTR